MAKEPKKLDELFHDTLKDVYFAEKKIFAALPKMAKAAQSEDLAKAFEKHHGETEGQIARLEQVFEEIGEKPQGKTCDAIMGILDEGKEIMDEYRTRPLSTPVCSPPPRPSSITKCRATARCAPGPKSLATASQSSFCKPRSTRKKRPTRR